MSQNNHPAPLAALAIVCPLCCLAWTAASTAEPCPVCGPAGLAIERAKPFRHRRLVAVAADNTWRQVPAAAIEVLPISRDGWRL